MNSILKNTIVLASLCIFFSCNPITEESEDNTCVTQSVEKYDFKSITYHLESSESISMYEFSKVLCSYKNETGITQSYTIDYISGNVSNSFRFYNTDLSLIGNYLDSIYINIPVSINTDNNIILSDTQYLYKMGVTDFPAIRMEETISIEPHQTIIVECLYQMIKYEFGYTAVFTEHTSGKELNISGKWEGCFLKDIYPEIK
ncbi:MAG: hypothetical protein LBS25_04175 [Candidatus Symbiothrix sp.]|jgi:hypothetical protein|nr:hypothetical protein [Candidatus Symbiothrix sp.]